MSYPQYEPYPPTPAPTPSGGTAITAGVLACVGCAGQLLGGGMTIVLGLTDLGTDLANYDSSGLLGQGWFKTYALVTGSIAVITAILLGVAAVLLFTRKPLGRVLVVAGCAVVVIAGIAQYAVTLNFSSSGDGATLIGGVGGLIGLIFPIATAILALVPPTTRWLNHDPSTSYAPPVARYPYGPASPPVGPAPYPSGPAAYPSGPAPYPSGPTAYPSAPATVPPAVTPDSPIQYPQPAAPHDAPHPAVSQPDPAKSRTDETMRADDAQWRRPPSDQ